MNILQLLDASNGRKYKLFLVCLATGMFAFLLSGYFAGLASNLVTILGFITGLYALFCTGNVAAQLVAEKGVKITSSNPSDDQG
jgi:hypothetical protein